MTARFVTSVRSSLYKVHNQRITFNVPDFSRKSLSQMTYNTRSVICKGGWNSWQIIRTNFHTASNLSRELRSHFCIIVRFKARCLQLGRAITVTTVQNL